MWVVAQCVEESLDCGEDGHITISMQQNIGTDLFNGVETKNRRLREAIGDLILMINFDIDDCDDSLIWQELKNSIITSNYNVQYLRLSLNIISILDLQHQYVTYITLQKILI